MCHVRADKVAKDTIVRQAFESCSPPQPREAWAILWKIKGVAVPVLEGAVREKSQKDAVGAAKTLNTRGVEKFHDLKE